MLYTVSHHKLYPNVLSKKLTGPLPLNAEHPFRMKACISGEQTQVKNPEFLQNTYDLFKDTLTLLPRNLEAQGHHI